MRFEEDYIYDMIREETEKAIAEAGIVLSRKEEMSLEEGYGHAAYAYAHEDWQSEEAMLEDIRKNILEWIEFRQTL